MVGRQVLAQCRARGINVRAASRRKPAERGAGLTWRRYDLETWKSDAELSRIFPDVGAIVHAGAAIPGHGSAISDDAMMRANVQSCLNLGQWALRRSIPMVFLSSASVYAEPWRRNITETAARGPNTIAGHYGLTKRLAETALEEMARDGLALTVLRPSSVYGPGIPAQKMIPHFLRILAGGGTVELAPPLGDRHNLIAASDVAAACLAALSRGATGTFNVGAQSSVSVREIARACRKAVGCGKIVERGGKAERRAVARFDLDSAKAQRAFGFVPQVDLVGGLAELARAGV